MDTAFEFQKKIKSVPVNQTWLGRVTEEAFDPQLPICDPHHHFWDHSNNRYLLDEFLEDTGGGHNVRRTVFVECLSMYRKDGPEEMKPVGETEFAQGIAAQSASGQYGDMAASAGIVGFADLNLGTAVESVLEAHIVAGRNRFRGIRNAAGWDESDEVINSHTNPPRNLYLEPKFREGFAFLEKYDLVFDAWLYHPQLKELVSLANAFPGVTIVLNHIGGPLGIGPYAGKRKEVFEVWKQNMLEVVACPNVMVKLGGITKPLNGFGWYERERPPTSEELAEATAPYFLFCIEQFGVKRCMFESNFPVDKVGCSYTVLWNSFKRMTHDFSGDERTALFHDTAARVYSLI